MVVSLRLRCAYPNEYGEKVKESLKGTNFFTERNWVVEISGLKDSNLLQAFRNQFVNRNLYPSEENWEEEEEQGVVKVPIESENGCCYVATAGTDELLNCPQQYSMPIPAAIYYLNLLEKCGMKILTQTTLNTSTPQGFTGPLEHCIIWTLVDYDNIGNSNHQSNKLKR